MQMIFHNRLHSLQHDWLLDKMLRILKFAIQFPNSFTHITYRVHMQYIPITYPGDTRYIPNTYPIENRERYISATYRITRFQPFHNRFLFFFRLIKYFKLTVYKFVPFSSSIHCCKNFLLDCSIPPLRYYPIQRLFSELLPQASQLSAIYIWPAQNNSNYPVDTGSRQYSSPSTPV